MTFEASDEAGHFWQLCMQLVCLHLLDIIFSTIGCGLSKERIHATDSRSEIFPRIRELQLMHLDGNDFGAVGLDLIERCPNLETFAWTVQEYSSPMDMRFFVLNAQEGVWTELQNLTLHYENITDENIASILKFMRRVTTLSTSFGFGPLSLSALLLCWNGCRN
ncbi:hypothetical protein EDD21DRAFT_407171 [Dissophora ornata]|nr:hypothetical protein EDD21DRAFT_407171 [Dissophora ornata]